jgi:YfiH family protein
MLDMIESLTTLPQPNQHFEWLQAAGGAALVCRPLAAVAPHLFTTREWLLGSRAHSNDEEEPWTQVAAAMNTAPGRVVRVRQVHGACVADAREAFGTRPEADIIINADDGLTAAVQAADCAPILIASRRRPIVAAAHAGWRGMAGRVPAETVRTLERRLAADPADLIVAIGPSIGACCYEVGEDVRAAFARAGVTPPELNRWFREAPAPTPANRSMAGIPETARPGHYYFDGWTCVRDQLTAAGVPPAQIFSADLCTASHPRAFPSYRRDGRGAGRLAAVIRPALDNRRSVR